MRLGRATLLTAAGAVLVIGSTFLPWYEFFRGWTAYAPLDGIPEDHIVLRTNAWQSFRYNDIWLTVGGTLALIGCFVAARRSAAWIWTIEIVFGCALAAGTVLAIFRPALEGGRPSYGVSAAIFGALLIAAGGVLGTAAAER